MRKFYYLPYFLFLIFLCACGSKKSSSIENEILDTVVVVPKIQKSLVLDAEDFNFFFRTHPEYEADSSKLKLFYFRRSMQYAWITENGLNEQAGNFINQILQLNDDGLKDDSLIPISALERSVSDFAINVADSTNLFADVELRLTLSFFRYANRVWGGVSGKDPRDFEWFIQRKPIDEQSLLDSMLMSSGDFFQHEPVFEQYGFLKKQLIKYRNLEQKQVWDSLVVRKKELSIGDSDSCLKVVKQRLFLLGDLPIADSSFYFNESLKEALMRFQSRCGLVVNGNLNFSVVNEFNIPLQERIQQIIINMERCRWVPAGMETDYIAINIPEFRLHVIENGEPEWSMNVVVGTEATKTVIFNGLLSTIVFSPNWNIPSSILQKEILPALRKNPRYLASHQMEVIRSNDPTHPVDPYKVDWKKYNGFNLPYVIRQKPGPRNSLGQVKFLFPNSYSIYLHDTPAKHLFEKPERNFSHGCIRISEPEKLADYLLRNDSAWNKEKILSAMNSGKEKYVKLNKKIPVFIAYFTCWVDKNGSLNFRKDIYGHDQRLGEFLFSKENIISN